MIAATEARSIFQYIGHKLMKLLCLRTSSCWHQIEDIISQGKKNRKEKKKRKKKDVQMVNLSTAKIERHTCGQGEIDTVASQVVVSVEFSRCFSSHPSV